MAKKSTKRTSTPRKKPKTSSKPSRKRSSASGRGTPTSPKKSRSTKKTSVASKKRSVKSSARSQRKTSKRTTTAKKTKTARRRSAKTRKAARDLLSRGKLAKNLGQLHDQGPHLIEEWGASYSSTRIGSKHEWYALVRVLAWQGLRYDLEDVDPDEEHTVTLYLGRHTPEALVNNLEEIVLDAVNQYGLTLAEESATDSVVIVWRKQ